MAQSIAAAPHRRHCACACLRDVTGEAPPPARALPDTSSHIHFIYYIYHQELILVIREYRNAFEGSFPIGAESPSQKEKCIDVSYLLGRGGGGGGEEVGTGAGCLYNKHWCVSFIGVHYRCTLCTDDTCQRQSLEPPLRSEPLRRERCMSPTEVGCSL